MSNELKGMIDDLLGDTLADDGDSEKVAEMSSEVSEEDKTDETASGDIQEENDYDEDEVRSEESADTNANADTDENEDLVQESESEEDPLEELKKQNELLQKQLNEAYANRPNEVKQGEDEDEKAPDFFGDWNYDDIIDSEENFKKFITEFGSKVRAHTEESVMKKIPNTVSNLADQQFTLREKINGFYKNHEQLASVRPFVAEITKQIYDKNPNWTTEQVLEETAKKSYEALGIKPQQKKSNDVPEQKPAFATNKSTGRAKADPKLSALEEQIADLIAV